MKLTENFKNSLHIVLKDLIEKKSVRDKTDFTAYQLAKEIGMPRSLITSLTHSDKVKRVTNPRISTLIRIVEYFRSDGFNITLEDLLGLKAETIDIQNESVIENAVTVNIPIYSFEYKKNEKLGIINLELNKTSSNVFGLIASIDISSLFKAGSIFIIDQDLIPESNNLVAVKLHYDSDVLIKKYQIIKNKVHLKALDKKAQDIVVMPTTQFEVLGVVIQVNVKT